MNRSRDAQQGAGLGRREFLAASAGAAVLLAAGALRPGARGHALRAAAAALRRECARPGDLGQDDRLPLRQAPQAYVDNLNKLVAGTEYADMPLEKIIAGTAGQPEKAAIFNNAAQVWNHTFYWNSMKPGGGGEPPAGAEAESIEASFGSVDACKKELAAAAVDPVRQRLGLAGPGRRQAQGGEDRQRRHAR